MDKDSNAESLENFIQVLTEAGFNLQSEGDHFANTLSVSGSVFQQSLREHLTGSTHPPRSIEIFVTGCDAFITNRKNFIKALHPTEESFDLLIRNLKNGFSICGEPNHSLIRLLLDIPEVQPKLMQCLLERFSVAWGKEYLHREENLPSLILSHLTGLNRIDNPLNLADVLLNALKSASPAVPHLLTTAILKIFGELDLPHKDAAELRANSIKLFLNVPLESIPLLMAFVFNDVSSKETASLIRHVRQDFDQAFSGERKRRNVNSIRDYIRDQLGSILADDQHKDCFSLAVKSLHSSMENSRDLADIWLQDIEISGNLYYIDLLILLEEYQKNPVRIEHLFNEKLRSKSMTEVWIREAFKLYNLVLDNYFNQLLAVAISLLFSKDPMVIPHGSILYLEMVSSSDVTAFKSSESELYKFLPLFFKHQPEIRLEIIELLAMRNLWKELLWLVNVRLTKQSALVIQSQVFPECTQPIPQMDSKSLEAFTLDEVMELRVNGRISTSTWSNYLAQLPNEGSRKWTKKQCHLLNTQKRAECKQVNTARKVEILSRFTSMMESDEVFAHLYVNVVYFFACALKVDVNGEEPSQAGMWTPSIGSSLDKSTFLGKKIATSLHRRVRAQRDGESQKEFDEEAFRSYEKNYICPLRERSNQSAVNDPEILVPPLDVKSVIDKLKS